MRARKPAAVSTEDSPPPEEVADAWPPAEVPAGDPPEDAGPLARLCLECGTDGCREHREIARLEAPSRTVLDAVERLRRIAAEHRAAARALRALVLSQVARGRGDLETTPAAAVEPCPRCLIRDAEAAAAATGVPKATARRPKSDTGQQALPFKVS